MIEKVVRAFTGTSESEPIAINVSSGDKKAKMVVWFGTIRLYVRPELDLKEVGEEFDCTIRDFGKFVEITPNVVKVVIENRGVMASCLEEDREALREWFEKRGIKLIKTLL